MPLDLLIWGMLIALGAWGFYMVVERVLFHRSRVEANPVALQMRLALPPDAFCRYERQAQGLGWLNRLLRTEGGQPHRLRLLVEYEIHMTSRFQGTLGTVASAAMAVGLLGTVLSLYLAGGGKRDVMQIVSLGMGSTVFGLVVAIPLILVEGSTRSRTARLLDQMDAVAARLDAFIAMLVAAPPPSPTANRPTATETAADIHPKRVAPRNGNPSRQRSTEPGAVKREVITQAVVAASSDKLAEEIAWQCLLAAGRVGAEEKW